MIDEIELIGQLQASRVEAFKTLCYKYSEDMILLAYGMLEDSEQANRIVCDILQRLMSNGCKNATPPLHRFLYGEIRKACELLVSPSHERPIV
jgi:hypothetical protein